MSGPRYRRAPGIRAFVGKDGGWTLVTRSGEFLRPRNAASLCLWEALSEATGPDELVRCLERLFPRVGREVLRRDALCFLRDLEALGFVERCPGTTGDAAG
jgi:hypothetical protein